MAYGVEEVDVALQLDAQGIPLVEYARLEVFHDTDLAHHESVRITAGSIRNQALLVGLQYPLMAFPFGILQWLNKIRDNLIRRRWAGSLQGALQTPGHLWKHRSLRRPVSRAALRSFRALAQSGGREL